jgi:hypothetical protein
MDYIYSKTSIENSILLDFIKNKLKTSNNRMRRIVEHLDWYLKHNYKWFLDGLITSTNYLKIDTKSKFFIKQRIYHLEHNITTSLYCNRCKKELKKFGYIRNIKEKTLKYGYIDYCYVCNTEYQSEQRKLRTTDRVLSQAHKDKIGLGNRGKVVSDLTRKKLSLAYQKNAKNPEFIQACLDRTRNPITRKKQSETIKQKILSGDFTPCVTNSWANSRTKIDINGLKLYRSTWDAAFQILNPHCEYEKIRIPYINTKDNTQHIYIVDFVDEKNKILYEIKPKNLLSSSIVLDKTIGIELWCKNNNYKFKYITNDWFKENAKNINYKNYDPKLYKGMVQFL